MRFVYKLQALLNWKKNLEELAQMRLADKIMYFKTQEEEIQNLVRVGWPVLVTGQF